MGELITRDDARDLVGAAEHSQYLTFVAGGECFAISIMDVKELIEVGGMTQVPMTPAFIRGVINLRGSVVAVVDLASRLGRPASALSKRSCIVLVDVMLDDEAQVVGMLVDEVREILELNGDDVQPAPRFGADIRTDFIKAMGRLADDFIILLDINHVLSIDELSAIDTVSMLQRTGEVAAAGVDGQERSAG